MLDIWKGEAGLTLFLCRDLCWICVVGYHHPFDGLYRSFARWGFRIKSCFAGTETFATQCAGLSEECNFVTLCLSRPFTVVSSCSSPKARDLPSVSLAAQSSVPRIQELSTLLLDPIIILYSHLVSYSMHSCPGAFLHRMILRALSWWPGGDGVSCNSSRTTAIRLSRDRALWASRPTS